MEREMITENMAMEDLLFDAPIPGQSLTQSPDSPMPYEQPPEFTNFEEAQDFLFNTMMDLSEDIVVQLNNGVPVSFIGPQFVVVGASQGKWNPDIMLLLIEPSIYITLFIAEISGIEDYVLDFDEEFETLDPEVRIKAENHIQKTIKGVSKKIKGEMQSAPISELMPPSLLAKAEETTDGL